MDDLLKKQVNRVCGIGALQVSSFVQNSLKPSILQVKVKLHDDEVNLLNPKDLKLNEETSPESKLRLQELQEYIDQRCDSKTTDKDRFYEDFLNHQETKYSSLLEDKVLEDAYQKAEESSSSSGSKRRIKGVVLRRSPKYVSMISLDGSNEFLVKVEEPFNLLGVKIKVGDALSVIVDPNKTVDLFPELICCSEMSKEEVTTFFKNLKQVTNNPSGIFDEFLRAPAAPWYYILNESVVTEDKEYQGEISKNILEICKIFSDMQGQAQMTTTIGSIWDALEDSKFFNKFLPEIVKNEAWQRDNVDLVQNFLENLLKVHPECGIRATGILKSLIIPEGGLEFNQKLFSIIAQHVPGVSKKPKHLNWNQKSVIPLPTDLHNNPARDGKNLPSIKVANDKGSGAAYSSEEEYIKTYYTLLREECFHKVKKGIYSFLAKGKADPKDNMVYCVTLFGILDLNQLSIQDGISLVLEIDNIDTNKVKDADPDNNKWLMPGNLVCLSLDATFNDPVWGIISKEDVNSKCVHVSLCTKDNRLKDAEVITQLLQLKNKGFQAFMIESNTFYPAYGPPLEVLRKKETVPFKEQLVKVKKCLNEPPKPARSYNFFQWMFAKIVMYFAYFTSWIGIYPLGKTYEPSCKHPGPNYLSNITKHPRWDIIFKNPSSSGFPFGDYTYNVGEEFKKMRENPKTEPILDDRQLDAVEQVLFNKIALIQGPPGTGKSFVGNVLLHLLLSMEVPKCGPILIVTYKNNALDEFLEKIMTKNPELERDVVRVGRNSECTPEVLQRCNLSHLVSGTMEKKMYRTVRKLESELNLIKKEIDQCFRDLEDSNMFTAALFLKEATDKHLTSMCKSDQGKLEKCMREKQFRQKYREEILNMIREPLKAWLPSNEDLERFAGKVMTQDGQSNKECSDKDADRSDHYSSPAKTPLRNEDDDRCNVQEILPSDDLEQRLGAIGTENSTQEEQTTYAPSSLPSEEVLISLPVIPDEKLGNFKSILNAGDIQNLTLQEKIHMVYALQRQHSKSLSDRFLQLTEELSQKQQRRKELRNQHCVNILKERKVIGMTVSGAAIRARWLESIKPSVMIVEEAAEILESQLVAVIPSSVQHLIMIGDHRQLPPQVHYKKLSDKYNFNVSMFERLIRGGLEYAQLNKQGRMNDELAELVRVLGFYENYETREEVVAENRLPECLTSRMFFFKHNFEEKTETKSYSKYNSKEAGKIIQVATFLLKNGVSSSQITILCSYRGQVNYFNSIFEKQQPEDGLKAIKVTTIDSFQGKENDIILLSLVCSYSGGNSKKSEATIGYLERDGRICVAISRARCGLYLFGNADLLSDKSKKCWKKIIELMRDKKCLGNELSFLRQPRKDLQHPGGEKTITCIKDMAIGDAPNTTKLKEKLKIRLDPKGPFEDGLALLAEEFSTLNTQNEISFLRSQKNPTECLLEKIKHRTIKELRKALKNCLPDLVTLIDNYVAKYCKCNACLSSSSKLH